MMNQGGVNNSYNGGTVGLTQQPVNIVMLNLIPTREAYKDVFRREYTLNADYNAINSLENILGNTSMTDGGKVNEAVIATHVPNLMGLNAAPNSAANIVNGWSTQRLRFIMVVESNIGGNVMVSYLQGYSEYYDPTYTGLIDDNMYFYINSITNVMRMVDPLNGSVIIRPLNTFNIIVDEFGNNRVEETIDGNPLDLKLIRPSDIVNNIKDNAIYGNSGNVNVINLADNVDGQASVSARANNNPVKHFTKTLNSFMEAKLLSDISYDTNDVLKAASNNVAESSLLSTPFITALYNLTGDPSPYKFTLAQLASLDPGIAAKTHMPDTNQSLVDSMSPSVLNSNDTEDLFKQTIETVTATIITQSISGMLIECMLSNIVINSTNINGLPETFVTSANSFIQGIDIPLYVNKLIARVNSILMPEITQNGLLLVSFNADIDLLGDATISVSINNQPSVLYRLPIFADSLYSPVISSEANKNLITEDFSTIMDLTYAVGTDSNFGI